MQPKSSSVVLSGSILGDFLAASNEVKAGTAPRSAGEMAGRMASLEWSKTSIGAASFWPVELKTLSALILNSAQPMFVVWGAERIWLYNDAFIPILGRKHPTALGLPSQQVWAEAWDTIGPMFDQVFQGKPVHMDDIAVRIDKRGEPEETHFAFSYNPVRTSGADSVGGILGVCTETTDRFLAESRERLAAERQISLFEQAPGFIIIMRGPDHVVEFVNDAHRLVFNSGNWLGNTIREASQASKDKVFSKGWTRSSKVARLSRRRAFLFGFDARRADPRRPDS